MPDPFPRILTTDELRFEVLLAVMKIPRSLLRQWASTNDLKSDAAREQMVGNILQNLARFQVRAPAPLVAHGDQTTPKSAFE